MKKIKRKIALLLAFVMVFAILPVNVEAARMDPLGQAVLPTDAQNRALLGNQPAGGPTVAQGGQYGWFVGFNHPLIRNIMLDAPQYSIANFGRVSTALVTLPGGTNWLRAGGTAGPATTRSNNAWGVGLPVPAAVTPLAGAGAGNFPIMQPGSLTFPNAPTPTWTTPAAAGVEWLQIMPGVYSDGGAGITYGNSVTVPTNSNVMFISSGLPNGRVILSVNFILANLADLSGRTVVAVMEDHNDPDENLALPITAPLPAQLPGPTGAELANAFNMDTISLQEIFGGRPLPTIPGGTILWNSTVNNPDGTVAMAAWLITPTDGQAGIRGAWHGGTAATLVVASRPTEQIQLGGTSIAWPIAFARGAATATPGAGAGSGNVTVSIVGQHDWPGVQILPTQVMYTAQAGGTFNFNAIGTANTRFSTFIDIGEILIQESLVGAFDTPWWRIELNLDRGFSFAGNTTAPAGSTAVEGGFPSRTAAVGSTAIGLGSWRPNTGLGFGRVPVDGQNAALTQGVGLNLAGLMTTAASGGQLAGTNINVNAPAAQLLLAEDSPDGVAGWNMTNIAGDANRRITMDTTINNQIVQDDDGRVRVNNIDRISDGIRLQNLRVVADDTARPGPVNIEVVMTRWVQGNDAVGLPRQLTLGTGQNNIFRNTIQVAFYDTIGIILELAEDQDPENFRLTSGMREWTWAEGSRVPTNFQANNGNWDAVIGDSVDPFFHRTARVRLTETVPGVLPFTGLTEVLFSFGDGIQVLGVTYETNNAQFIRSVTGGVGAVEWGEAWFINGNTNMRSGDLDVLVRPDYVSMRPHLAEHIAGGPGPATPIAWIEATFYLSVQPGYEHLFGSDIVATASFRGGGINLSADWGDSEVVAIAYDPITVSVQETTVQDDGATAWGQIRTESIGDITITETEPGALRRNRQLWVGVEGGVSLGWGQADLISARATGVTTDGTSGLSVGNIVVDQRGFWVTITGESVSDVGSITFTGVEITGALVADNSWGIIVAGDTVADNFGVSAFTWDGPVFGGGTFTRIGHGLFTPEPYLTAAFSFDGTDVFAPAPGVTAPGPGPAPGPGAGGAGGAIPVVLSQNLPYFIQHGPQQGQAIAPSFEMRAFGAGQNASAFVSVGAIADILGWTAAWDQGTQTATLTTNDGRTIVFVNGQATATVNGQTMQITNADGTPSPTYINNDRLMLSLLFFQQNLGVSIIWMGGTPGAFQIMIVP